MAKLLRLVLLLAPIMLISGCFKDADRAMLTSMNQNAAAAKESADRAAASADQAAAQARANGQIAQQIQSQQPQRGKRK